MTNVFAYVGSLIGLIAFLNALLPAELRDYLQLLLSSWSSSTTIDVHEWITGFTPNQIYELVDAHIGTLTSGTRITSSATHHLDLSRSKDSTKPKFGLANGESIVELFRGVPFKWIRRVSEATISDSDSRRSAVATEKRFFRLLVDANNNALIPDYLDHVVRNAESVQQKNKKKKLYTNFSGWEYRKRPWRSVGFDHPATFESMAMDPELKNKIKDDLLGFMNGEAYFRKVGRAWKRGYLLYGPPGTGKSSLIAAIADFTGYDIYDLELADVKNNSMLRQYLTTIEDIDCSLNLKKRPEPEKKKKSDGGDSDSDDDDDEKSKVTLSGLLNFTDGLWSSTGSERILVFTTNHVEHLDPALIRSGRMDVHINLSYCGFPAFKVLARTHLDIEDHDLFPEIEKLLGEAEVTPAEAAELFIQSRSNATAALQSLIAALDRSKAKNAAGDDGDDDDDYSLNRNIWRV